MLNQKKSDGKEKFFEIRGNQGMFMFLTVSFQSDDFLYIVITHPVECDDSHILPFRISICSVQSLRIATPCRMN